MEINRFPELQQAFFSLHGEGEYARAQALVEANLSRFPEQADLLNNWRMCTASLQNEYEKAEQIFEEAVQAGAWWSEELLREDPDLAGMQGRPEFERLVQICRERSEQAMASSKPEILTYLPEHGRPGPFPLILMIHGRGGSAGESAALWRDLTGQGWMVALAQSSRLLGKDSYAWDDHELAEEEITVHYQALAAQHPLDTGRIFLAGFSQGGGLAITLALKQAIPAAGFLGVAPFIHEATSLTGIPELDEQDRPRGYLITGGQDQGQEIFGQIEDLLHARGISYQREEHPDLAHEYPEDWEAARARALQFLTGID